VLLNFASRAASIDVPPPGAGRSWRIALSTHGHARVDGLGQRVTLNPLEALVGLVD